MLFEMVQVFFSAIYQDLWRNPWAYLPAWLPDPMFSSPLFTADATEQYRQIRQHMEECLARESQAEIAKAILEEIFFIEVKNAFAKCSGLPTAPPDAANEPTFRAYNRQTTRRTYIGCTYHPGTASERYGHDSWKFARIGRLGQGLVLGPIEGLTAVLLPHRHAKERNSQTYEGPHRLREGSYSAAP
jgi:hypothetical protein